MLFNSLEFLWFFAAVATLYYAIPGRFRWGLLLVASYGFYAAWKPEYLLLIWASTLVAWLVGLRMGAHEEKRARRRWLIVGIVVGVGLLGAFKYYNFFGDSLNAVFAAVRLDWRLPALDVLLPVGISFYTFQTLSYVVDVYRGRRDPEPHVGIFALYVAFFPQLVAGPIERSTRLLPQFHEKVTFDAVRVRDGLALMLLGFFKKCVVADRVSLYVDEVYADPGATYEGLATLVATYFFAWQGYCDFSGYSDIAVGASAVFGYRLMENFRRPFLATSIREFWARWHISLTTWFRDYMYYPMSPRGTSKGRLMVNLFVVFTVSGLWHGAHWNVVLWGSLNGVFLVVGALTARSQDRLARVTGLARVPWLRYLFNVFVTYNLVALGLMLFRTQSVPDFLVQLRTVVVTDGPWWNLAGPFTSYQLFLCFASVAFMIALNAVQERRDSNLVAELGSRSRWVRWPVYLFFLFATLMFGEFNLQPFYYFQF